MRHILFIFDFLIQLYIFFDSNSLFSKSKIRYMSTVSLIVLTFIQNVFFIFYTVFLYVTVIFILFIHF
nr:MAG TPA: hypothetical protein [Caudoviricetes sp.]